MSREFLPLTLPPHLPVYLTTENTENTEVDTEDVLLGERGWLCLASFESRRFASPLEGGRGVGRWCSCRFGEDRGGIWFEKNLLCVSLCVLFGSNHRLIVETGVDW